MIDRTYRGINTPMARYFLPGLLFAERETRELQTLSPDEARERAPAEAFAFQLYERPMVDFDYDESRFEVTPKPQNESARYYLGGTVYTPAEVEALGEDYGEDYRTLLSNMRSNGWKRAICTHKGNWQPLEDGDVVLDG